MLFCKEWVDQVKRRPVLSFLVLTVLFIGDIGLLDFTCSGPSVAFLKHIQSVY